MRRPTQEGLTMERTEVIEMMSELKLYGMKSAYDEIYATALKRQHEPQRLGGDLLKAEYRRSTRVRSDINSRSPSCRSPRMSTTSSSRARRSTRISCATSPAASSSPSNATSSWSVEPARA